MTIDLYLVRHGETEWNRQGRIQGQGDSPLTERGQEQALSVGKLLATVPTLPPALLLVSPLGRTRATAGQISRHLAVERMETDARIGEVAMGAWEGMTLPEIAEREPSRRDDLKRIDWCFRSPGGETLAMVQERARDWLDSLPRDRPAVAVSHGLVGRVIRGLYLDLRLEEMMALPVPQDVVWHLTQGKIRAIGPL
ncbi:MAG: histidine phosphatase family protein [Rhodospirillaceae bacterium]|nr:histidine phosphatase family protein [Rhodospirillaceae bacterium]